MNPHWTTHGEPSSRHDHREDGLNENVTQKKKNHLTGQQRRLESKM